MNQSTRQKLFVFSYTRNSKSKAATFAVRCRGVVAVCNSLDATARSDEGHAWQLDLVKIRAGQ